MRDVRHRLCTIILITLVRDNMLSRECNFLRTSVRRFAGQQTMYVGAARSHYPQHDAGTPILHMTALSINMYDSDFWAPSSSVFDSLYRKRFTHFPNLKETGYGWEDAYKPENKNPVVHTKPELCFSHGGDPHKYWGFGQYAYTHYNWAREPLFPDIPVLSRGELASGANLVRTEVWKTENEPSVISIGRFAPDNFRAMEYGPNAPVPANCLPPEMLDFRTNRLAIGHADRRPFMHFVGIIAGFVGMSVIRCMAVRAAYTFWPSKDLFAAATVEVDLRQIRVGQNFIGQWRGKPFFVKRRSPEDIEASRADDALVSGMRDPQTDAQRAKRPEWLIVIGVCTHLGCIPFPDAGDYKGYFCPCHGSHYDLCGRIRKGPAPKNLAVPNYEFLDDFTVQIG